MSESSSGSLVKVSSSGVSVREGDLGSPKDRLIAQLIDGAASAGAGLSGAALYYLVGLLSPTLGILSGLSIPLALIGYQWMLLTEQGQTVGKRAMGLRIVDAENGGNPGFVKTVVLRNWVSKALCSLGLYPLINVAPIFWNPRRCVHDYIAGTVVVKDGGTDGRGRKMGGEAPEDEFEALLQQMKEELAASTASLVDAKVTLRKSQMKLDKLKAEADRLQTEARSAVTRGADELARQLLQAQRQKAEEVAAQSRHIEEMTRAVAAMQAVVDAQNAKLEMAKHTKGTLKSRVALLEAGASTKSFDAVASKIEEKIGDDEVRLEVQAQLRAEAAPPSTETLPEPAKIDTIEDEMEQLRREIADKKK